MNEMKKISEHLVFLLAFLISIEVLTSSPANKNLSVSFDDPNTGVRVEKDLVLFIEDGKKSMDQIIDPCSLPKKLIMVLGVSGTGKSTLINYLNGVSLVSKENQNDGLMRVVLADNAISLPGGFQIGSKSTSKTIYPAVHVPLGEDFAYVDNPGFSDTRPWLDIANAFFREKVTSHFVDMKFAILVTSHNLYQDMGKQFRQSIKLFSGSLGVFEQKNESNNDLIISALSKSICIIVTRGSRTRTLQRMKQIYKFKLLEILNDMRDSNSLTVNEDKCFRSVIENEQFSFFSTPLLEVVLDNLEKNEINTLLQTLTYSKKSSLGVQVKLGNHNVGPLTAYLQLRTEEFEKYLEISILKFATSHSTNEMENIEDLERVKNLNRQLTELSLIGSKSLPYREFMSELNENFLEQNEKQELNSRKDILEYFADLLPEMNRRVFFIPRQWLSVNVVNKLNELISQINEKLAAHVHSLNSKLMLEMQEKLEYNVVKYLNGEKNNFDASYEQQAKKLEKTLIEFRDKGSEKLTFGQFISDPMVKMFLTFDEQNELEAKQKNLNSFVQILPKMKQQIFMSEKSSWISSKLSNKLSEFITELSQYQTELSNAFSFIAGIYTYRHAFVKISTVMSKINIDANVIDLKSVQIYAQHTVIFDVDYLITPTKYNGKHAPDLLVVSPRVLIDKRIIVDLSCQNIPPYPNHNRQALDANSPGGHGTHGLAGAPGHNGGNFIIISNFITDYSSITFVSKGGKGGPGQDGGSGANGAKGKDGGLPYGRAYSIPSHNHHNDVCNNQNKGDNGGHGGNAGRAGCGGIGGYPGSFVAVEISKFLANEVIKIVNYMHTNINGDYGKAGRIGKGGQHGDSCYEIKKWQVRDCWICERYDNFLFGIRSTNSYGPDGINDGSINGCQYRTAPELNYLKVSPLSNYEDVRLSIVKSFGDQVDLRKFSTPKTSSTTTTKSNNLNTKTTTMATTKTTSTQKQSQKTTVVKTCPKTTTTATTTTTTTTTTSTTSTTNVATHSAPS